MKKEGMKESMEGYVYGRVWREGWEERNVPMISKIKFKNSILECFQRQKEQNQFFHIILS